MTHAEMCQWRAYANKHGGLPLPRLVFLLATLDTMFNNANGGKAKLGDFWPALPAEVVESDEDAIHALFDGWG